MWSAENESGQHKQPKDVGPLQIVSLNSLVFRDFLLVIFHFLSSIFSVTVPNNVRKNPTKNCFPAADLPIFGQK